MPKTTLAERRFIDAANFYLSNLEATGASDCTIENYSQRLNSFYLFWTASDRHYEDPSFTAVQAWRDELLRKGLKPSTVRQYLCELGLFFSAVSDPELAEKRFFESNPVTKRLMPDTKKADKRPYDMILTDEQVMLLWRNNPVIKGPRGEYWPRNYAIVVLLLTTEIRNQELLDLTPADLDFEHGELCVEHGKGDKFRVVEFPEIAQTAVRLYLRAGIRPESASDTEPLFGSLCAKGSGTPRFDGVWKRGSRQWLSQLVDRHVRNVTGVAGVRSHDLRHVGARLDLNSGMPVEELQSKLGHCSVTTTEIYSGKLMARRARQMTAQVLEEREIQARRNAERLTSAE